jgi:hypothetical protein
VNVTELPASVLPGAGLVRLAFVPLTGVGVGGLGVALDAGVGLPVVPPQYCG